MRTSGARDFPFGSALLMDFCITAGEDVDMLLVRDGVDPVFNILLDRQIVTQPLLLSAQIF